jgi:hypothetical protein
MASYTNHSKRCEHFEWPPPNGCDTSTMHPSERLQRHVQIKEQMINKKNNQFITICIVNFTFNRTEAQTSQPTHSTKEEPAEARTCIELSCSLHEGRT